MKKILLVFLMVIFITSSSIANTFSDIDSSWAKPDIIQAVELGLVSGYPDGTFRPNNNIKRIEFIIIVNKILANYITIDYNEVDYSKIYMYRDINNVPWAVDAYKEFMIRANLAGRLNNKEYGFYEMSKIFGSQNLMPSKYITREEAVAIISLFINEDKKVDLENKFSDIGAATFPESIKLANKISLISGYPDGTFKPFKNISRAEATKILLTLNGMENNLKSMKLSKDKIKYDTYMEPLEVMKMILEYESKGEFYNAFMYYNPDDIEILGLSYLDYIKNPFIHAYITDDFDASLFEFQDEKISSNEYIVKYKKNGDEYWLSKRFSKIKDKWYTSFETNMSL